MHLKLIHIIAAFLFMVLYIIKTLLLVLDKEESLSKVKKATRIPEMIISTLFLVTGIWLFVEIGNIKTLQIVKLVCVFASIPLAVIGFKKGNKALAVVATLLVITSYALAEIAKKQPYPAQHVEEVSTSTPQESQEFGQEVYKANCAACHGLDGKKGLGGASDLSVSQLNKAGAVDVITNGRNNMAPFKDQLSEHEIDATADFIMTLKK